VSTKTPVAADPLRHPVMLFCPAVLSPAAPVCMPLVPVEELGVVEEGLVPIVPDGFCVDGVVPV
jgi:hypothetical protein